MNRIPLPQRTYADFSHPITELIRLSGTMKIGRNGNIIDVARCKFLSPILIGGVAALLKEEQERGLPSSAPNNCLDNNLREYLGLIRFPEGLTHTMEPAAAKRYLATLRSKTYIPIIAFPADLSPNIEREELIQAVEDLLVHQCGLDGVMLTVVKYLISELTGNVMYHAGKGTGFLLGQYMPNGRYLDLVIADTGAGLRETYLRHGKFAPETDSEALNLALNGRSTKNQPESRGFGIPTSRKMLVRGLGGSFFYWSGSAFLFNNATHDNIFELKDGSSYPGVYIALRIPAQVPAGFSFVGY